MLNYVRFDECGGCSLGKVAPPGGSTRALGHAVHFVDLQAQPTEELQTDKHA